MKGHIRKRGQKSWSIVVELPRGSDGKRRQKWHTFRGTKRDAQRELHRLLHELETGVYIEPVRMTVAEYLAKWLKHAQGQVAGKTFERYSEIVNRSLVPALGGWPLSKLQPLHIQEFYAEALRSGRKDGKGGLSPQTVLHYHRVLREALQQAVKWQILARNSCDAVEPPRIQHREMTALDEARTVWLLTAAAGTRLYAPIVTAVTTGCRRGELFGLRWPDSDLHSGHATIMQSLEQTNKGLAFKSPKTARARRRVSLLPFTVEVLKAHRKQQDADRALFGTGYQKNGLVFALPDGRPWPPDSFSAEFRKFRDRIGIKVRLHDLRHSHASQLLRQGIHPKIVSERLGHSTVGITMDVYSHVLPGMQEEAAAKLDASLRAAIKSHRKTV